MTRILLLVTILFVAAMPSQLLASGNLEDGAAKSKACIAFHNADGNSTVPLWPKIAGQSEKYLTKQLLEYRKGDKGARNVPAMYAIVQNLSDQDIADLAKYFSSQKTSPNSAKASLVELGEKIYREGNPKTGVTACIACHGVRGDGNSLAGFPKLSGQHPEYTIDQLKKYSTNERSTDPNGIMRNISQRLTDKEIEAVSSYVAGLH